MVKRRASDSMSKAISCRDNNTVASLPKSDSTRQKSGLTARVASGSIGSVITSLVVTPLEVVKVRVQAAAMNGLHQRQQVVVRPCPRGCGTFVLYNGHMDCILPKSSVSFFDPSTGKLTPTARSSAADVGTFGMMRRIFAKEGFEGIYAGLRPTLVMAVPNTVLYFSAYDELIWRFRNSDSVDPSSAWLPLVAGGSARLVASSVTAPFEFLRTRQAATIGHSTDAASTKSVPFRGLWHDFRLIVEKEGFATLYRGLRPTLWRDVPFSAIYWLSIESFREMWAARSVQSPSSAEQAGQAFINGAVAGMIAAACTTPFDVIKTREQAVKEAAEHTQPSNPGLAAACKHDGAVAVELSNRPRQAGTFAYLRHIAETEGVQGLWRGNQARMLKVAPACAIMISSYELGKRLLQ